LESRARTRQPLRRRRAVGRGNPESKRQSLWISDLGEKTTERDSRKAEVERSQTLVGGVTDSTRKNAERELKRQERMERASDLLAKPESEYREGDKLKIVTRKGDDG